MNNIKKKITVMCAAFLAVTSIGMTTFAATPMPFYDDNGRIVEYFDFDFESGGYGSQWDSTSKWVLKKYSDRDFVLTVSGFSGPSYSVNYSLGTSGSESRVTNYITKYGTGNGNASFLGDYEGYYLDLQGALNSKDVGKVISINGQFSPDNA